MCQPGMRQLLFWRETNRTFVKVLLLNSWTRMSQQQPAGAAVGTFRVAPRDQMSPLLVVVRSSLWNISSPCFLRNHCQNYFTALPPQIEEYRLNPGGSDELRFYPIGPIHLDSVEHANQAFLLTSDFSLLVLSAV